MRGVGYVSGSTLDHIQQQWASLIDAEVNVILFDRHFIKCHLEQPVPSPQAAEAEAIWRYMETMQAGQAICGNDDDYRELKDLQPSDTIVLTELETLRHAEPGTWGRMNSLFSKGVYLAILSNGFHSAGEFGDEVLGMMNIAFALGTLEACVDQDDPKCPESDQNQDSDQVIAAVHSFLGDQQKNRFEIILCEDVPRGWYRTFDPSGWHIFCVVDTTELSIGASQYIAVNPVTLEVRDMGRIGE